MTKKEVYFLGLSPLLVLIIYINSPVSAELNYSASIQETAVNPYLTILTEIKPEIEDLFSIVTRDLSQINHAFNGRISGRSSLKRVARSPLGRRSQCTVTRDKLSNLNREINRALSRAGGSRGNNCELSSSNADNCNELINQIQCGVNNMRNGFMEAIANRESLDEVNKWKNAYDDLSERHERDMDEVKRSVSEEYQRIVDSLKTDLQALRRSLNQALERLKKATLDLCISEISSGQTATAVSKFKELQDNTKLTEIVRTVYSRYGQAKQVENIVNFVKGLPSCNQDKIAYPALAQIMRENGHLGSPQVLTFYPAVETCMSSTPLENELERKTNEVLDAWGYSVRNNDYWQFKETVRVDCAGWVNDYWEKIVKKAYAGSLSNVDNILKFIKDLPCINQTNRCLVALISQMKSNGHINSHEFLKVAAKVKVELDFVNSNTGFNYGAGGREYYQTSYQSLQNGLPTNIRNLIWGGSRCTIKNRRHLEYLYAPNDYHNFNSDSGRIFTWGQGGSVREAYWNVETDNHAESFTIYNTYWGKYMFASGYYTKDSSRRWVFYWRPGGKVTQGNWKITPVDGGDYFTILNTAHGEYLYADGDSSQGWDSSRRGVFTWRSGTPQGVMEIESHWHISCNRKIVEE